MNRSPLVRKTPLRQTRKEGPAREKAEHPKAKEARTELSRAPAKCKHCKVKFTALEREASRGLHPECQALWAEAYESKLQAKRRREAEKEARADRVATRAKLNEYKKIPKLIAETQEVFNEYIRERDREKVCFVCERPFNPNIPGRALHAGHVRSRGAAGHLRFNEDNCMGECEGCNGPHGAKPHQIKAGAIRRIGVERFEVLDNDNAPHKWSRDELLGLKKFYRAKLKELKK